MQCLAHYFLDYIAQEKGSPRKELTKDAYEELQSLNWTRNNRELRDLLERLIILCGKIITGADVKQYANPKR